MSDLAIANTDGSEPQDWAATTPTLVGVPVPTILASPPAAADSLSFEGSAVGMAEIKISGLCAIDAPDISVSLDDLIRAVGVYRVVKVLHYVHPKTGETVRQQILAPVEPLVMVPFDSANPSDDGIVRARP